MSERETRLGDGEELEIAHAEDFGITRNGDGELNPIKQRIPGTDKAVRVKPMAGGDYEEWKDVLEEEEVPDDRMDAFFEEYISEGIGSNGYGEVPEFVVPGLVQAIKNGSGHEVFRAVQEQQREENLKAIQALDGVGEGTMSDLFEQALEKTQGDSDNSDDSEENEQDET